ncbi:MAG: helix-hairpin-helix domain-containing protein [Thermodesulfobacteriota bacterium]
MAVLVVMAGATGLLAPPWHRRPPPRPAPPPILDPLPARLLPLFFQPIPLNRADVPALVAIPGIGPQLAARIVARRQARGGRFDSLDQLLEVDGIGPARLAELQGSLMLD